MSRNAAATEIQALMAQLSGMARRGERLAQASGGMVDPMWFRAVQSSMAGAAGDLDSKGLLVPISPEPENTP